jgi:hypothetical protein
MRATNHNPSARREQITVQAVGDETLLYDEQRHMAFCLNATASAVWLLADGTRNVAEIAAAAGAEISRDFCEDVVHVALHDLRSNGLVAEDEGVASGDAAEAATQLVSRRKMLTRLGMGAAALLPVVASIVAPTAAQAYSGCVDCSVAGPRRVRRAAPLSGPGE